MRLRALIIGISAAMLLTACASTPEECDPREDQGFFGKIGCTVTGSYSQRITNKEQQVEELKAENARLNQLIRDLQDQDALIKGDYATRQRELDKVRSELYSLENTLAKKQALSKELEDKLNAANKQLNNIQTSPASATLQEKQRQIQELEAALDELSWQLQQM